MAIPPAEATIEIAASIDVVWQVMIDIERYGEWNPFIVRIGGPADRAPRIGDDLRLHVTWNSGRGTRTTERITRLDAPSDGSAVLEYEFRGPIAALGLVRGRREQRLDAIDATCTRYTTREQLRGVAARLAPLAQVQDGFERHAAALQQRAERLAGE